jgi:hypothetical protein
MKSWVARSLLKAQARAWRPTRRRRRAARSTASGAVDGEQLQRAARSTASGAMRERAARCAKGASERRKRAETVGGRNGLSGIRGGGFRKK